MRSRLVQWILSKVFPYKGVTEVEEPVISVSDWDKCKLTESEEFYGGCDGTWR